MGIHPVTVWCRVSWIHIHPETLTHCPLSHQYSAISWELNMQVIASTSSAWYILEVAVGFFWEDDLLSYDLAWSCAIVRILSCHLPVDLGIRLCQSEQTRGIFNELLEQESSEWRRILQIPTTYIFKLGSLGLNSAQRAGSSSFELATMTRSLQLVVHNLWDEDCE